MLAFVCNLAGEDEAVILFFGFHKLRFEITVGQAEAEGVEYLILTEGLKITVADIDVLGVGVEILAAEIICRGEVFIFLCNCGTELA